MPLWILTEEDDADHETQKYPNPATPGDEGRWSEGERVSGKNWEWMSDGEGLQMVEWGNLPPPWLPQADVIAKSRFFPHWEVKINGLVPSRDYYSMVNLFSCLQHHLNQYALRTTLYECRLYWIESLLKGFHLQFFWISCIQPPLMCSHTSRLS